MSFSRRVSADFSDYFLDRNLCSLGSAVKCYDTSARAAGYYGNNAGIEQAAGNFEFQKAIKAKGN